jgi:Ser/Thr protein kinase RdoA (MazF antagonist)
MTSSGSTLTSDDSKKAALYPMRGRSLDPYAYALEVVLPDLGLWHHPFVIQLPDQGGTASRGFRLVIERGPSLLVRVFDDAARARRNAASLRHLERLGLPAPRLLHADLSPVNALRTRRGYPRYATAETWIEGVRAIDAPDKGSVALQVAELLARFHAFTRTRWGRPGQFPELRPYARTVLGIAGRFVDDMERRSVGPMEPGAGPGSAGDPQGGTVLTSTEAAEIRRRFLAWNEPLRRIRSFQLVHNDANRRNFVLTPEKTLVAIDVRRISYEPSAEEVANALYHFCRNDAALAARFTERYLERAAPESRASWERAGVFFSAFNTLKRLHRRTGPRAAEVVHPGENAPGAPPGVDARIPQWKEQLLTLPGPGG